LHAAAVRLEKGLAASPSFDPPHGLANSAVEALLADRRERLHLRYRVFAGAALAAGLLVAVYLGYQSIQKTGAVRNDLPVARNEVQPAPAASSVQENVEDAGAALVGIVSRAVEPGRGLWPESLSMVSLPDLDASATPLDPSVQSWREAQQGMSASLEPVASLGRRFVNFFWQEIPTSDKARPTG
jgi:hypothetical protein